MLVRRVSTVVAGVAAAVMLSSTAASAHFCYFNNPNPNADAGRAKVDRIAYQEGHFHNLGSLPKAGEWHRIEIDAEKAGLVGKLVDGFAYLTKNGRALWDHSVLERDGKVVRVFCEDTVGIDRTLLAKVRVSVPGLKKGSAVRALFEDRTISADEGGFTDNFDIEGKVAFFEGCRGFYTQKVDAA